MGKSKVKAVVSPYYPEKVDIPIPGAKVLEPDTPLPRSGVLVPVSRGANGEHMAGLMTGDELVAWVHLPLSGLRKAGVVDSVGLAELVNDIAEAMEAMSRGDVWRVEVYSCGENVEVLLAEEFPFYGLFTAMDEAMQLARLHADQGEEYCVVVMGGGEP